MKTGHTNIVSISATLVASDDSLKLIEPKFRHCMYEEENVQLKIYKNYTQTNCYFECFYVIAQEFVKNKYNSSEVCVPWFFPTPEKSPLICNPWEAADFLEKMLSVSTMNCQHCLPGVNFINILLSALLYKNVICSFSVLKVVVFGKRKLSKNLLIRCW